MICTRAVLREIGTQSRLLGRPQPCPGWGRFFRRRVKLPARPRSRFDAPIPKDPFIREKFTKNLNATRKHAAEYFERFPKDPLPDRTGKLARTAI
jgi:hypothetical protein